MPDGIDPQWQNALERFIETGEAEPAFLEYLNHDLAAQQFVERSFAKFSTSLDDLADEMHESLRGDLGINSRRAHTDVSAAVRRSGWVVSAALLVVCGLLVVSAARLRDRVTVSERRVADVELRRIDDYLVSRRNAAMQVREQLGHAQAVLIDASRLGCPAASDRSEHTSTGTNGAYKALRAEVITLRNAARDAVSAAGSKALELEDVKRQLAIVKEKLAVAEAGFRVMGPAEEVTTAREKTAVGWLDTETWATDPDLSAPVAAFSLSGAGHASCDSKAECNSGVEAALRRVGVFSAEGLLHEAQRGTWSYSPIRIRDNSPFRGLPISSEAIMEAMIIVDAKGHAKVDKVVRGIPGVDVRSLFASAKFEPATLEGEPIATSQHYVLTLKPSPGARQ